MTDKNTLTEDQWRERLTDEQYRIARGKGTERAFTGAYWDHKEDGVYLCVCCGHELFDSAAKFDSGTGWPSFWEPVAAPHVATVQTIQVIRTSRLLPGVPIDPDGGPPDG